MPVEHSRIGPLIPSFNRQRVGSYLSQSVTPSQRDCLKRFFQNLRDRGVVVAHIQIPDLDVFYVGVCGHIIEFHRNGTWVENIEPGYLPP